MRAHMLGSTSDRNDTKTYSPIVPRMIADANSMDHSYDSEYTSTVLVLALLTHDG